MLVQSNLGGQGGRCRSTLWTRWQDLCLEAQPGYAHGDGYVPHVAPANSSSSAPLLGNMHVLFQNLGFTQVYDEGGHIVRRDQIWLLISNESECARRLT
jgi:hypothetical protein